MEEDAGLKDTSSTRRLSIRHKVLIIVAVLMTLTGIFTLTLVLYTWDRGQIAPGVSVEIPLGHLTLEEAQSKLDELKKEIYRRPVHFISGGKNFSIKVAELGLTYSYAEPLRQAYLIGREGNIFNRASSKFRTSWGLTFKPDCQWNDQVLKETLRKNLAALNVPAEDARFSINRDNSMQIVPEKSGKEVDFDSLMTTLKKQSFKDDVIIPVPFKTVKPTISKADLEKVKVNSLLSSYTTSFDPSLRGRTVNIRLAVKAIDGTLLKPGEVFSFNATVGPRTAEAGYQEALIIEGDAFVPGLGGGVCQVSSTLYNAVRLASPFLSVVERARHSLPIAYVPPGQDATVAYPELDFKFRNNSGCYLLIRSSVNNNTLEFRIYGKEKTEP
ncbi:VanW family protein [Desulfosporosinus sp. PR]|uniref:VanW family protein n=1 Tax=Candidatus Desulfosporosinus nitrosoreducens TaxID=3401928 RepID=UPI0027F8C695|nr:VanW family protein [Desulfosporosinus sp. PR]MDQ7097126.1 VanW family protein [Desulfosporosinus sp. PR]